MLGDTLTLLDGEEDEEPYGVMIPIKGNYGLTPAAEMANGRSAARCAARCAPPAAQTQSDPQPQRYRTARP